MIDQRFTGLISVHDDLTVEVDRGRSYTDPWGTDHNL